MDTVVVVGRVVVWVGNRVPRPGGLGTQRPTLNPGRCMRFEGGGGGMGCGNGCRKNYMLMMLV